VTIFECSKRYVDNLRAKFKNVNRVDVIEKAVSNVNGTTTFFEVSGTGSGSLLQLGELAKKSYAMTQAEVFEVETITLDKFFKARTIDILQIDVQGAEKLVLEGANLLLKRIKAVFTEISIKQDVYNNSVTFETLTKLLVKENFQLILLGTDTNGGGNALFIKMDKIGDTILKL